MLQLNSEWSDCQVASLPELGPGGSWSTCLDAQMRKECRRMPKLRFSVLPGMNGCHLEPPQDVAHVQFRSRLGSAGIYWSIGVIWCDGFSLFKLWSPCPFHVWDVGVLLASQSTSWPWLSSMCFRFLVELTFVVNTWRQPFPSFSSLRAVRVAFKLVWCPPAQTSVWKRRRS